MKVYNLNKMITIIKSTKENNWNGYHEVPYIEYREDGSIKCTGTEDFSGQRMKELKVYEILTKTGNKNKGGKNIWKHETYIYTFENPSLIKKTFSNKYPDMFVRLL